MRTEGRSGRTDRNRDIGSGVRVRGGAAAGKTAAVVLASLLLATGCQSKYQPIEINAAEMRGPLDPPAEAVAESSEAAGTETALSAATESEGSAETETAPSAEADSGEPAAGTGRGPLDPPAETAAESSGAAETAETVTEQTLPAFTDVEETVYVTGDSVNVRASCSTESDVIATLARGTAVTRTGAGGEWSRIRYQEKECYMASQYLSAEEPETQAVVQPAAAEGEVRLNSSWKYAEYSKINSGAAVLYKADASVRKGITVCVNAGHGTKGGSAVKTYCHPDGTPKTTGGSTAAGETYAAAVSGGTTLLDGTPEPKVTLALAMKLKPKLLAAGYDVLMIRESDDVQLDNIARTVIANNTANCHIALHWDSSTNDKGAFYMSVPGNSSYRGMEPVRSHWQEHQALGSSLISGLKSAGVKIFSSGAMDMDLTQTSYSTIPSVDIELGDRGSDHSDASLEKLANGLLAGVNLFFGQ